MTSLLNKSAVSIYLVVGVIAAIVVGAYVWFFPRASKPLESYLPTSTVFAVSVSRDQLFQPLPPALESQQPLGILVEQQRDQWQRLEVFADRKLSRLIWFVDSRDDVLSRGLLFQSVAAVGRTDAAELSARSWPDNLWVEGPTTHARPLSSHYFVAAPETSDSDYFSNSQDFLSPDPLALYLTAKSRQLFDPSDYQAISFLPAAAAETSDIRLASTWTQQRLTLRFVLPQAQIPSSINNELLQLALPSDYRLALAASSIGSEGWQEKPMSAAGETLGQFIAMLTQRYALTADNAASWTARIPALVITDTSWLAASHDQEELKQAAEQLASWFHPVVATSTLPDGTVYRQYVKRAASSTVEQLGNQEVDVWRRSADAALYLGRRGGLVFLSDSPALLRSQMNLSPIGRKTLSDLIGRCSGEPIGQVIEAISIEQPKGVAPASGISRLEAVAIQAGNSQVWHYCLTF